MVCFAHQVGLSRGTYTLDKKTLRVVMVFSQGEMVSFLDGADLDKSGKLSPDELDKAAPLIKKLVTDRITVTADGARCKGELGILDIDEEDGVEIRSNFECSNAPSKLKVELGFLDDLSHGHRHVARAVVTGGASTDAMLYAKSPSFDIEGARGAAAADTPARSSSASSLFIAGALRAAKGYECLVFLLGLVLVARRARDVAATALAFLVASSVALVIAASGAWAPSDRMIDAAVALSIAYVGVDNLVAKDPRKRVRIAIPFGFIQGLGFAGALAESGVGREKIASSIATFDSGVAVAEIVAIAIAVAIAVAMNRMESWRSLGMKLASGAIAALGLALFAMRLISAST